VVMVYDAGQELSMQYIYADHLYYDLPVGSTLRIPIYHPNTADNNFVMAVNKSGDPDSVFFVKQGNVIIANGAQEGRCVLRIETDNAECNTLDIVINVVSDQVDIDHPYTLSGANFCGTSIGAAEGTYTYKVNMAGADASEYNKILWTMDNTSVARIARASSGEAVIVGVSEGQTVLRINHLKSVNEKNGRRVRSAGGC